MAEPDDLYSKKNVISGFVWKILERGSSVLVSFVVSIILARIVDPSDFGLLAIINVFVAFCSVFVTGGTGNSLIQKKGADELDFSSMFWMNVGVGALLYLAIFFSAPLILAFFDYPQLVPMLRVLGINLIILSINSIQCAFISKQMLFRNYFFSTLGGKVISGLIGIIMAFLGAGIWSLVVQAVSLAAVETIILWFRVGWRPAFAFSIKRVRPLYSYAWKIVATNIVEQLRIQVVNLVIGKRYPASQLAYYNRGDYFPNALITNLSTSISTVLFPVLSDAQDDSVKRKLILRKWMSLFSYCAFPLLVFMIAAARPLVVSLLTDKWIPAVPYLQIACGVYAAWIIEIPIRETIKSLGFAGAALTMQLLKVGIVLAAVFIFADSGVMVIALALLGSAFFSAVISMIFGVRYTSYSIREQIADFLPGLLLSLGIGAVVMAVDLLSLNSLVILIIQIVLGGTLYVGLSKLFHLNSFDYIKETLYNLVR